MTRLAQKAANISSVDVEFINQSFETLPLEDSVVDTILMTYTLCSIPDTKKALNQMIRVLKPSGKLIFCEHGVSPDMNVLQWQDRLNPVWKALGGGCHLNRNIPKLIEDGGFKIKQIHTYYLPGWKFASYNFQGVAVPL